MDGIICVLNEIFLMFPKEFNAMSQLYVKFKMNQNKQQKINNIYTCIWDDGKWVSR